MMGEICEKGATSTDWIPTSFGSPRSSRMSHMIILQASPHADVRTIEGLLCKKVFRSLPGREYTDRK